MSNIKTRQERMGVPSYCTHDTTAEMHMCNEIAELRAALEAAEKNAERYLWIRNSGQIVASATGNGKIAFPPYTPTEPELNYLDITLDRAIEKAKEQGK